MPDPALIPFLFLIGISVLAIISSTVYFLKYRSKIAHINSVLEGERVKLVAMVSSLTDGAALINHHNQILINNPAILNYLNIDSTSQFTDLEQIISSIGSLANLRGAVEQARTSLKTVTLSDIPKDNRTLEIVIEPVQDNFPGWVVIVIKDKTTERNTEKTHDEFTAMMIHELRTPLTTLRYSTNTMLSSLTSLTTQDLSAQLNVIQDSTSHLLDLVNDLLDISKIEAGKFQLVKDKTDLKHLLDEKITAFLPLASQKSLKLELNYDQSITEFNFDARRISEVLDNLISNALKYTKSGQVNIRVKYQDPDGVLIEVADTGDGITKEDQAKLFSKYAQFGKGKTGEVKGTGLGLVIAKGIVEAHGGKMWVKSDGLGQGSTFSFTLPFDVSSTVASEPSPTPPIEQPSIVNPWAST